MLVDAGARADVTDTRKERPADLTDRFVETGSFEIHFASWHVNLSMDHEHYLRDRQKIKELLTSSVKE